VSNPTILQDEEEEDQHDHVVLILHASILRPLSKQSRDFLGVGSNGKKKKIVLCILLCSLFRCGEESRFRCQV
jgi:hypothetical protein